MFENVEGRWKPLHWHTNTSQLKMEDKVFQCLPKEPGNCLFFKKCLIIITS